MATRLTLLAFLLCSCATEPERHKRIESVLMQPLERQVMAALLPTPPSRGLMRLIHTPTSCWSRDGVLPYVYPAWGEPRVGRLLAIDWVTRACRPYPDEPVALLISFDHSAPVSLTPFGHRDCYLAVGIGGPRDHIVTPGPGSILSREEPGRISLRWTPGPEWAGVTIYTQLIVLSPAGSSGWLNSPGLELQIGG